MESTEKVVMYIKGKVNITSKDPSLVIIREDMEAPAVAEICSQRTIDLGEAPDTFKKRNQKGGERWLNQRNL